MIQTSIVTMSQVHVVTMLVRIESRGIWTPSNNASLSPTESITQTAYRSVQPFFHRWPYRVSLYVTMGRPFPSKLPFPLRNRFYRPPSNTWFPGPIRVLNPNGIISISSAVFAGLTSATDR